MRTSFWVLANIENQYRVLTELELKRFTVLIKTHFFELEHTYVLNLRTKCDIIHIYDVFQSEPQSS